MQIKFLCAFEYALVVAGAWLVAGFLTGSSVEQASDTNISSSPLEQVQPTTINSVALAKIPLFGKALVKAAAQPKVADVVKVSRLRVKLIGTVVAGRKSAAMVLINGSKQQQVFFIGEMMQPAVALREVRASEIVVDNHGKSELISLESGQPMMPILSKTYSNVRQASSSVPAVARHINKQHLRKQMRNFSALMSQARVSPHFTNKKADGFLINQIVKGSLYEEIGLQNGDVIQKVNGESVTSAEQAMRMYRELQHATFIDVEINRGGTTQQVNYTIQ